MPGKSMLLCDGERDNLQSIHMQCTKGSGCTTDSAKPHRDRAVMRVTYSASQLLCTHSSENPCLSAQWTGQR